MKFHRRRVERLTNKFRKLEQPKPRKSNSVSKLQPSNRKQPPTASKKIVQSENAHDLATFILAKIGDQETMRHIAGKTQVRIKE